MESILKNELIKFGNEAKELYIGTLEHVPEILTPSSSVFIREYVSANLPFIVRGAISQWRSTELWSSNYFRYGSLASLVIHVNLFSIFRKILPNKKVTVAVTPDGFADSVYQGKFVLPEEREMEFAKFLDILEGKDVDGVFYIQKQNSNLTTELSELLKDCEKDIAWATEGFDKSPDAVNFWMGQGKAVTSMHKDPYENIYCVIEGEKTFTLHPPSDRPFIPYKSFQTAQHCYTKDRGWFLKDCGDNVPWIDINPLHPDLNKYPFYKHAHKIQCTLHKGDLLYLPSLWFHHVTQTDNTIAVNYWYDMAYDIKYSYFELLSNLSKLVQK